jgi:prepilin-type N-terminal cleavage/methylation domain-containing protein
MLGFVAQERARRADNRVVRRVSRNLRDERGFTIIELLVASLILVLVLMGTMQVLDTSTRMAHQDTDRGHAIREAQVGLDRLVREARHARAVVSTATQVLELDVRRNGVDRRVRFDCSVAEPSRPGFRRCVRTVVTGPGAGASEPLVTAIGPVGGSSTVFTYTPASGTARYVSVQFSVAVDGGRVAGGHDTPLVLSDGTSLRNVGA